MRIMLVTDAWEPQVNGVVRTISRTVQELRAMGHEVHMVTPDGFKTFPLPTYPEIKLAIGAKDSIEDQFEAFEPEAVHIATEGTLGLAARRICIDLRFPFSTSYHTQYPEYVAARFWFLPTWLGYLYVRWFHNMAGRIMVATPTMRDVLVKNRFRNLALWTRGVDTEHYSPALRREDRGPFAGMKGPILLYVGRVAVEKNVEAFLSAQVEGTKVVVGDGPARADLEGRFKDAIFLGAKFGTELATCYANADVFVFPSYTDTFGLVILEAMSTGTPVAAFVAPGPQDIIPGSNAGVIGPDLAANIRACLDLDRTSVRSYAEGFSWRACAEQFLTNLDPLPVMERYKVWNRIKSALKLRRRKKLL
jgi:glycosyltransferase involved in cell wall biosynthesis